MFHVEHFPNFLFLMALDIVQYNSGDPITAGTTYQIPGEMNSEAWILQSTTQGAVFQMTATAPTDEDWSNIQDTQFHINGTVTGLILPILSTGYFRVVKEPVTEHATMALVEQEFQMEVADPINPFVAGTPVAPGYYDLSSLNLEAGKMYVLSVLPEQDKDYPQTPGIVTDETFSAVIVGLTGTKATQVILRGVTTVGSHLFVMTGAKPILHLGGRSNVKFNITVSPVVFSAGGGSFDPSQPATITGLWDLQNVSGINLVDEGPIILGKGDNAVKIHGSGTGSAVIEGANGATLDIAVPVDFSEPITFQDTVSYNRVGSTGEPIFQRWVMPRNTLVLKGYEAVGSFGFANEDGSQNYIGIDATGNVSFLKNTNHSGASTFSSGVTMDQSLNVAGPALFTGGIHCLRYISTNGNITFTNTSSIVTMVLTNFDNTGSIFHKSPDPTDPTPSNSNTSAVAVYAVGQLDRRYAKLEASLTQAQYEALATKDPRTFYFTSDTSKLHIVGEIFCDSLVNVADGQGIQFGTSISMYSSGLDCWIEGPAGGKVRLNIPIEFLAPAEGTTLTDNMGVNVAMGDARYAKVVSLTKAAYSALTTKDPTTIYLITDTTPRMWAIGDMEIVTADVPA